MPNTDLRKGRFSQSNRAYVITTLVGAGRRPPFADIQTARLLVAEVNRKTWTAPILFKQSCHAKADNRAAILTAS